MDCSKYPINKLDRTGQQSTVDFQYIELGFGRNGTSHGMVWFGVTVLLVMNDGGVRRRVAGRIVGVSVVVQ